MIVRSPKKALDFPSSQKTSVNGLTLACLLAKTCLLKMCFYNVAEIDPENSFHYNIVKMWGLETTFTCQKACE